MLVPLLDIIKFQLIGTDISMEMIYKSFGINRQLYYRKKRRIQSELDLIASLKSEIDLYRYKKDRRAGSRSLFYNLNIKYRFGIGVNKFERLLSQYGLTLKPLRVRVVTTKSTFQSWNYKNLTNGLIISNICQLVVGDITHIVIGKDEYYLFCLTDVFSMRIVGHCISDRMRKEEAIIALNMFLDLRNKKQIQGCIHHSDGGGQYFSKLYHSKIRMMKISVAKSCLENGLAEQKNGFIKNHLLPTINSFCPSNIQSEIAKVIHRYNHERKQQRLGWKSPVQLENYIYTFGTENMKVTMYDHEKKVSSERIGFIRHNATEK